MQLSRLRPLNLSYFIFLLQIRRSLRLFVCAFCIRVEALYTLKHHPAESVTSDFFHCGPYLIRSCIRIIVVNNTEVNSPHNLTQLDQLCSQYNIYNVTANYAAE